MKNKFTTAWLLSLLVMTSGVMVGCSDDDTDGFQDDDEETLSFSSISTGGAHHYGDQQAGAHTCGVATNGTLWCWGSNTFGQLGDGSYVSSSSPVQVGTESDWILVEAKGNHTCGIRGTNDKGSMWCWGQNKMIPHSTYNSGNQNTYTPGILGLGNEYNDVASVPSPSQVGSEETWVALASGQFHNCGIQDDGTDRTMWCWGVNSVGAIPVGSSGSGEFENEPRQEDQSYTDWQKVFASTISYCSNTSVGLRSDNTLWGSGCSGYDIGGSNSFGTTAEGDSTADVDSDGDTDWVTMEISGNNSWCGIKEDGTLWCGGSGDHGVNGSGAFSSVGVVDQVGADTTWTAIAIGRQSAFGINNGALYAWGRNHSGELGLGDVSAVSECTDRASNHGYTTEGQYDCNAPVLLNDAETWVSVDSGRYQTCALTDAGDVYCWGHNSFGQAGVADLAMVTEPTKIN